MEHQSAGRGQSALAALEMMQPILAAPRSYRGSIRARGPFVALVPPALLGIAALLMLRDNESTARGLGGFVAAVLAAPLLPILGAPLRGGSALYTTAALGSALLWLVLGLAASRRATRMPIATWGDFWGEYVWMMVSVWVGVLLSLVAANLVLGRAVL